MNDSPRIIYLAKNEIYARHGYIFSDSDLNNYFMSQLWYIPEIAPADFDDSVFNEYEKANLQLLSQLDKH
ncbi:YARHG domain-containing protein [Pseudobutyrivibrio sp. YE44]|uniref:YARHG domain-containing protein n=1 Tax=Pseudobutyrivibrio sp. YE44 TaxID=1520802 RepID=UPI003FA70E8F